MEAPDYTQEEIPTFRSSLMVPTVDIVLRLIVMEAYRFFYNHSTVSSDFAVFIGMHIAVAVFSVLFMLYREQEFLRCLDNPQQMASPSMVFSGIFKNNEHRPEYEMKTSLVYTAVVLVYLAIFLFTILHVRFDTFYFRGHYGHMFLITSMATLFCYGMLLFIFSIYAVPGKSAAIEYHDSVKEIQDLQGPRHQTSELTAKLEKSVMALSEQELMLFPLQSEDIEALESLHSRVEGKEEADRIKLLLLTHQGYAIRDIAHVLLLSEEAVKSWLSHFGWKKA